jgi:hypothetical protein
MLREIADRRRPTDMASGWGWLMTTMRGRPAGTDPLQQVKAEDNRLKAEGMAQALRQEVNPAKRTFTPRQQEHARQLIASGQVPEEQVPIYRMRYGLHEAGS